MSENWAADSGLAQWLDMSGYVDRVDDEEQENAASKSEDTLWALLNVAQPMAGYEQHSEHDVSSTRLWLTYFRARTEEGLPSKHSHQQPLLVRSEVEAVRAWATEVARLSRRPHDDVPVKVGHYNRLAKQLVSSKAEERVGTPEKERSLGPVSIEAALSEPLSFECLASLYQDGPQDYGSFFAKFSPHDEFPYVFARLIFSRLLRASNHKLQITERGVKSLQAFEII